MVSYMEQKQQQAPFRESAKRGFSDGANQTSQKKLKPDGAALRQRASSWTPKRSTSPEPSDQEPDVLPASVDSLKSQPDCIHKSIEGQQQQCCADMSVPDSNHLPSRSTCPSLNARKSTPLPSPSSWPRRPQDPPDDPPALEKLDDSAHLWAHLQDHLPPHVTPGNFSMHSYPANVALTELPHRISCIPQPKVCEYLAIAAVRHRDIHEIVEIEFDRVSKILQEQIYEDASVLSFVKEHVKVQNMLYQDYDDFPSSKKQEIVQTAVRTINQIILSICCRVRLSSLWKTKFNAFLALIWIGKGIVSGLGMLPNAIRAHMVFESKLVYAIKYMCDIMYKTEIWNDGARLVEALTELNDDREDCFEGLEGIAEMLRDVLAQGRMC